MTQIKTLALIAGLAGALMLISAPEAQAQKKGSKGKIAKKSKASKKSKTAPTKSTTKKPKTKNYDFMADEIDGDRVRPDGTSIFGIQGVEHGSLIRLRADFIAEIVKSADMI